jgi:hypothetical protein
VEGSDSFVESFTQSESQRILRTDSPRRT